MMKSPNCSAMKSIPLNHTRQTVSKNQLYVPDRTSWIAWAQSIAPQVLRSFSRCSIMGVGWHGYVDPTG
jgi:hypothetical protein